MRRVETPVLLVLVCVLTGCVTPQVVKKPLEAQVEGYRELRGALREYGETLKRCAEQAMEMSLEASLKTGIRQAIDLETGFADYREEDRELYETVPGLGIVECLREEGKGARGDLLETADLLAECVDGERKAIRSLQRKMLREEFERLDTAIGGVLREIDNLILLQRAVNDFYLTDLSPAEEEVEDLIEEAKKLSGGEEE